MACAFCAGNEAETPPEVWADRPGAGPADGPGWRVRAVPNKFPALAPEEGVHEVVVNAPRHVVAFHELSDEEAARAVAAWRTRLQAVAADPRGLWPFLFLNQGAAAGASLAHSHAQVMGLPFAPPRLVARERAMAAHPCALCADFADDAMSDRRVAEVDGLVAWCPAVPPLSGAVRVAPRAHLPGWDGPFDPAAVGRLLRRLLGAIGTGLGAEAANLWLHARRPGGPDTYHWHLDVVPRLGTLAGMELGAGVIAANRAPEAVAASLRGERL